MRSLFEYKRHDNGFLAPLRRRRSPAERLKQSLNNLPPAAAPLAVTVVGGLLLVAVLGSFIGRQQSAPASEPAVTSEQQSPSAAQPTAPASEPTQRTARLADRADTAAQPSVPETANVAAQPSTPSPAPVLPAGNEPETDGQQTAAIPRTLLSPTPLGVSVPVAETEQDLLALEEQQMQEVEADLAEPSSEATAAIEPSSGARRQAAVTTRYVNMRAGPQDDAEILRVVPAMAEIDAETDCGWCSVTYDGATGYIYRTFISYTN